MKQALYLQTLLIDFKTQSECYVQTFGGKSKQLYSKKFNFSFVLSVKPSKNESGFLSKVGKR